MTSPWTALRPEAAMRAALFLSQPPAAKFELDCGPGALVRMGLIHGNQALTGALFTANVRPMAVDSATAGAAMQVLPCDGDGRTIVHRLKTGTTCSYIMDPNGQIRITVPPTPRSVRTLRVGRS